MSARAFICFLFLALSVRIACAAEFTFRINEDFGTLDWGYGEVNGIVVQQLMEGLTLSGERGEALPGLAQRWKRRGDKYIFELRPYAKWSDGQPVCAQQFVDAWMRVVSKEFASPYAHYLADLKQARALDCQKLEVSLQRNVSYFPALASHWVLFPIRLDLMKKYGRDWMLPENLAVTGPFMLAKWKKDEYFLLKRNSRYYGKPASEEALRAIVVGDDSTAVSLFREGKIDWLKDIPFLERGRLKDSPSYHVFPAFIGYHLGFNMNGGLDRGARCALARSIDKSKIPQILKGDETPANGLLPPGLAAGLSGQAPAKNRLPDFDVAQARKLWEGSRHPQTIEFYYYSKDIHAPIAEWLQEEWRKNLGARIKLVRMDGKSYWGRLKSDPPDLFLSGITAAYAHPYSFLSEFLSKSAANWGHFSSTHYDALAHRSVAIEPGSKMNRLLASVEKLVLDEQCAVVPLYFRKTATLVSPHWDGVFVNPMSYVYLKNVNKKK